MPPQFSRRAGYFFLFSLQTAGAIVKLHFPIRCLTFSRSGGLLAVGSETRDSISRKSEVVLYDLRKHKQLEPLAGPVGRDHSLSFSPDEQMLAVAGGVCRIWSVADVKLVRKLNDPRNRDFGQINCAYIGKDLLATVSMTKVYLWDPNLEKKLSVIDGCDLGVASPDGKLFATLAKDKAAVVWDISDPEKPSRKWDIPLKPRENHRRDDGVLSVHPFLRFASGGSVLVGMTVSPAGEGYDVMLQIRCWSSADGKERSAFTRQSSIGYSALATADGSQIIMADEDHIRILKISDGSVINSYKRHESVTALSLSSDERLLAVGFLDGNVELIKL